MPISKSSTKNIAKKENQLLVRLREDEKLDKTTKMSYISIANIYLDNFDENINKTSIDMNKEYPFGIDTWKDFLNYPIVRQYIQSFRDEQISQIADKGLMEGDKDAVSIKKVMQDKGPNINNSNIVVIRLPEKRDFDV